MVDSPKDLGRNVTPWMGIRLYLMGSTSLWPYLAPAIILVGLAALSIIGGVSGPPTQGFFILVAQLCLVSGGQAGFTLARRMRFLWLKRGTDRLEAFDLAERVALFGFALSSAALTLVVAVIGALAYPREQWWLAGGFWLVQILVSLCFVYLGLLLVRGWTGPAILGAIGLIGLWIGSLGVSRPDAADAATWVPVLIPGIAALAFALRTAARWRWQRIDWLLLRPIEAALPGEMTAAPLRF